MGLIALQHDFHTWLVNADEGAATRLASTDRRGLGVYQNNYRRQLETCLAQSYPQTLAWIGQEAFETAAIMHIDQVPPHSWTLDDYAIGFPATLAKHYPRDADVIDLARLELALSEAFVAEDAETLNISDLSLIDWDVFALKLVPSASFLDLSIRAVEIWSALDKGLDLPAAQHSSDPSALIVWRKEYTCCFQQMDADEKDLLPHLVGGLPFEVVCAKLVERHGADPGIQIAGELLARWTHAGMLCQPYL